MHFNIYSAHFALFFANRMCFRLVVVFLIDSFYVGFGEYLNTEHEHVELTAIFMVYSEAKCV